jgi:hypothetical protein
LFVFYFIYQIQLYEVFSMAIRKNTNKGSRTRGTKIGSFMDALAQDGLSDRIQKLSEQTGLSCQDLLQKWALQEETLIGILRRGSEENRPSADPSIPETQEDVSPNGADYRKILFRRVQGLRKKGMSLKGIADLFNKENLPSVRGKGQWYASSIVRLLKAKIAD